MREPLATQVGTATDEAPPSAVCRAVEATGTGDWLNARPCSQLAMLGSSSVFIKRMHRQHLPKGLKQTPSPDSAPTLLCDSLRYAPASVSPPAR